MIRRKREFKPVKGVKRKNPLDSKNRRTAIDEPKNLLVQLELQGNLLATNEVQMMMARRLYVKKNKTCKEISKEVCVHPSVIDKWAVQFQWDEARAEFQYRAWTRVANLAERKGINVDLRADRNMHTIEYLAELMMQQHMDSLREGSGGTLQPKDLQILAKTIESTNDRRRLIRGAGKEEKNETRRVEITGTVDILHSIAQAVSDSIGQPIDGRLDHQERTTEQIQDAEYELLEDN